MKDLLLVLPVMIPMSTGILTLLAWRRRRLQRGLSLAGAAGLVAAGVALFAEVSGRGILSSQIGGWPAPFGITFVADLFSAVMVLVAGLVGFTVALYSLASIDPILENFGYHPLYHFLLMGVSGAFLTGDLFNLYVWFEVMLVSSFVLMALGGGRRRTDGAVKYVTLNLLSSTLFLVALGILYGLAGTLNMADLAGKFAQASASQPVGVLRMLPMLFLIAFGIKAAAFPLFFWLPASYHTPPIAISALFAGLLTKVGVYALIRVFSLIFVGDTAYTHTLILVIAGLTMVTGVFGAISQNEFRRILSFHIVSQIGYMIMGLGLGTPLGLAAAVFYIAHHIVVKTNLFLISGVVQRLGGTLELGKLGGLYAARPLLAGLFLVPALSLAGVPPLSGFFAKLGLVQAGVADGRYLIVAVSLAVSLLTLYSMTKIWNEAFWKKAPEAGGGAAAAAGAGIRTPLVPIALLAVVTVLVGLAAGPVFGVAERAGAQLARPAGYIEAVLGGGNR
ncbi:MAG: Na+/H+ antiporter subunit D [Acidobacteria bacterium]|nr:Na+/H+ antiporter subunit D [Acidobacteriota bacterium]